MGTVFFKNQFRKIKNIGKRLLISRKPSAIILTYHSIANVNFKPNWLSVSPGHFAKHLEYVKTNCQPLSLSELIETIRVGAIPNRAIVITFDDGYSNNLTHALPLLERFEISASIFIPTGFMKEAREFWWDRLSRIFLETQSLPPNLSLEFQGEQYDWKTQSDSQRENAFSEIKERIKPLPEADKDKILRRLEIWAGDKYKPRKDIRVMSIEELRELAESKYINIGAHTISHSVLPSLSLNDQKYEIVEGRKMLMTWVNTPIEFFAYPNGDYTEETKRIVSEAGYKAAVTTNEGCVNKNADVFALNRCHINDWEIHTFINYLNRIFDQQ